MENMENLALEGAEKVEEAATEQIVEESATEEGAEEKVYTEAEFNAKLDEVLGKKIARKEAKIRKEFENKYSRLENVLHAGTGKDNVEEVTDELEKYYESKGVQITPRATYSDKELGILAAAEAKEIIDAGYDEVVDEVERLALKGVAKMDAREKEMFKILAEHRSNTEKAAELSKLGVTEDIYNSKEFKDFAGMFNPNTSVKEIYNLYAKMKPKKEVETMGSMKDNAAKDKAVKEFYTHEEASKFTRADYDKSPALYEAVKKSMTKW